ncbi:MAG: Crp/Fnr family transcriptional regulator [Saprospiraceae bacterium]|jgi:CRP/FNR family cyclic AMP-dependent transcriptional regulator|nr:Crp/Fnr family transcriptional regulator [Saprospiraceae bacterium]
MQQLEIIESIEDFPIAASLTKNELSYLVEEGDLRMINKSDFVFRQGEVSDEIYFLLKGAVKVSSNISEGREVIKMVVHPKALLSEQSFIGEGIHTNNAISMSIDTTVLAVKISVIKELIKRNSNFSIDLIEFLGKKLKYTEDRLESLALNDARERIIQFLRINAQSFGQTIGFEVLLKHDFTQQDIANFTGTSRQTVTTVMNDLKKHNQIYFKRKSILIRDLKALC